MEELKKRLAVKDHGVENSRGYFTVMYKENKYRVLKFRYQQKTKWRPEYVDCIIKDLGDNNYKITQDLQGVVADLYHVGGVYPFSITAALSNAYEITDENGLRFRLTQYGDAKLELNKKVQCEVTNIQNGYHVIARLVETQEQETTATPFVDLSTLTQGMALSDEDAELLESTIFSSPYFSAAKAQYEAHDIEWLLTTIKAFDRCLALRVESRQFLNVFKTLAL